MKTPGQRIKEERTAKGWSQQRLADEISRVKKEAISRAAVAQWENGDSKTQKPENLFAAAEALGLSPRWVLDESGDKYLSPSPNMQPTKGEAESSAGNREDKNMRLATVTHLQHRDLTTIPQFDAGGSMGFGVTLPDQPGIIHNWQVNAEWLQKNARAHTGVGNLRIVTGFGDSMRPMYNPGDPLLVDCGVKSVVADGIYFFRVGDEGFIKRLQKIPTATGIIYLATSVNPEYRDFEITPDMDFEVMARVIRVWCGTDF